MSALSIAVSGIGYGALAVALSGFADSAAPGDLVVPSITQTNTLSTGSASKVQTLTIANLAQSNRARGGAISDGIVVEAGLTTGILQETRIKKPGIPSDAPEWQRTMFEILTGRRGNKITVAPHQTLTFSATPTQAECEALYSYISEVRQSIDQLTKRFDS